jgi:hypothetical protein
MDNVWTKAENLATVDSYVSMLKRELSGVPYVKIRENEALRLGLLDRSKGAVEYKLRNISAVLLDLGWLYIRGYKPARNVQSDLRYIVEDRLNVDSELEDLVRAAADFVSAASAQANPKMWQMTPPATRIKVPEWSPRTVRIRRDYVYRDERNRGLGLAGEIAVVAQERRRLTAVNRPDLAERVEHVSVTVGDGLGYDVRSFEADGSDLHIEVKTTRYAAETPFFVSINEVRASEYYSDQFQLTRVFRFGNRPGFYALKGSLREACQLEVDSFTAVPR